MVNRVSVLIIRIRASSALAFLFPFPFHSVLPKKDSADEFNNRKSNKTLNLTILKSESKIGDPVAKMIEGNVKRTSENLFRYLYRNIKAKKLKMPIRLKKQYGMMMLKSFYGEPVPVSVWEKFKPAVMEDETEKRWSV